MRAGRRRGSGALLLAVHAPPARGVLGRPARLLHRRQPARARDDSASASRRCGSTHFAQVIHPDDLHLLQEAFDLALAGSPQVVDARGAPPPTARSSTSAARRSRSSSGDEVVGVHGITEDTTEAQRVLRELSDGQRRQDEVPRHGEPRGAYAAGRPHRRGGPPDGDRPRGRVGPLRADRAPLRRAADAHGAGPPEFSGLEAHRTVLDQQSVDVRELVGDVAAWAAPWRRPRS